MRARFVATVAGASLLAMCVLWTLSPARATGDPPEGKVASGAADESESKPEKKRKKNRPAKGGGKGALPEGAVLHLTFDADALCKSGDEYRVLDTSGEGNHATIRGAEPEVGRFGGAMSFNGRDAFLEGSDAALPVGREPSTFSLWFYPREAKFSGLVAYGKKGRSTARGIACNPMGLVCWFRWGGPACHFKQTLSLKEWHHLAITFDGTKSTLYVDGEEKASEEKEFDTVREIYYLGRNLQKGDWFDGLLDEVAIFDRPLSADEVKQLFTRKPTPAAEKPDLAKVKACKKP